MKNNNRNEQLGINLVAVIFQNIVNYGISFFFTPYIISIAGSEAYGFVNLANNVVNYASIITLALNSVAGRFITIAIHQKKEKEANLYFNSVLWANSILSVLIVGIFIPIILNIENIFDVPKALVPSVRLLFVFIVLNFVVNVVSTVFSVATFVTNKLYLANVGNCIGSFIRVLIMLLLFGLFPTNIAYVGFSSLICSLFLALYNMYLTQKLEIGIKINLKMHSMEKIRELIATGIWSSVSKLSQVFSDGLDLLLSNIWIDVYTMGQLSIAYTIPTIVSAIVGQIPALFNPQQTYYYAKGEIDNVVKELKNNMMLLGFVTSIIFAGIVVWGYEFFSLWTPNEDNVLIHRLAIISIISVLVSGAVSALHSVFLLTNRLKVNSIVWLFVSFADVLLVLIFLNITDLGVYAIAGVSKIVGVVVNLLYTPIYASHCLKIKKTTFYPFIFRYMICTCIITVGMYGLHSILPNVSSWGVFLINCIISAIAGSIFNYLFMIDNTARLQLKKLFFRKESI